MYGFPPLRKRIDRYRCLVSQMFRKLQQMYEDGDLSSAQVKELFDHVTKGLRQTGRVVEDTRLRFESQTMPNQLEGGTRATPGEAKSTLSIRVQ